MQLKVLPKTMLLVTIEPAAVKATALDWIIIKLFIMSLSKAIIHMYKGSCLQKIAKFGNKIFGVHFAKFYRINYLD